MEPRSTRNVLAGATPVLVHNCGPAEEQGKRQRLEEQQRAPYVVLRDVVSPSYGSPTQGCRVWFKKLCRLWLPLIGRPVPHDGSAANEELRMIAE
ncbi:hypothetical protein GCM10023084_82600 [Streptomyces lacrimifluminis]|uniref:Uncharacterized protein n=1 Tax=Streptomyces lacrimifluminis TaxID=1500077 RepID=A0A917UP26_9ACTN|nr:hypothetical protein GCM10012282_81310 [Streptomyces lacrimifluminis]